MNKSSLIAAIATLVLHVAMLAVLASLSPASVPDPAGQALQVKLPPLPPPPSPPLSVAEPSAAMPPAAHSSQKPKRRVEQTRNVKRRETARPEVVAKKDAEATVSQPNASAPSQHQPRTIAAESTPSQPPAVAPPVKTSATEAAYASTNRTPPYPRLSRSNEEQGTVVLRVLVTPEGTAGAVEIKNSAGYPLLDESARSTVKTWRFKPATVDGRPVAEWYQVSIPFTLQNN